MNAWKEGCIRDLVRKGRYIQQKITTSNQRSSEDKAKTFARLMLQGKVNCSLNNVFRLSFFLSRSVPSWNNSLSPKKSQTPHF